MIKILAYKYPTYVDVSLQREVKPLLFSSLKENVQDTIKKLLFDENHDYLLIALTGKLFICEPTNHSTKTYSRREISYHPESEKII